MFLIFINYYFIIYSKLTGDGPTLSDYILFGHLQWSRAVSPYILFGEGMYHGKNNTIINIYIFTHILYFYLMLLLIDDVLFAWRERMLSLFNDLGRNNPGKEIGKEMYISLLVFFYFH